MHDISAHICTESHAYFRTFPHINTGAFPHINAGTFTHICAHIYTQVLSGDREGLILMWQIDAGSRASMLQPLGQFQVDACQKRPINRPIKEQKRPTDSLGQFQGHDATVEDVCFHPHSDNEFCSVGDDKRLLFWDERAGREPTLGMPKRSKCDLHCLDWNATDVNLLVTGTADGESKIKP